MASAEHIQHTIEDVDQSSQMYEKRPVPDFLADSSQRYCVLSIVAPKGLNQKCDELAIRVYGCKATVEEAHKWSKELRDDNPYFDVYVMDTCKWGVLPPDIGKIKNVQTTNDRLQMIYDQFKEENIARTKDIERRLQLAHSSKKPAVDDAHRLCNPEPSEQLLEEPRVVELKED